MKYKKKFFSKNFLKKTFIIAEIGINHNGNFNKCKKMIKLAAKCGAGAVKIQTINIEDSYHKSSKSYNIFKNKDFSLLQIKELKKFSKSNGVIFFSTPGDISSLKKIMKAKVSLIKISSGLLTNLPLVQACIKNDHPIILSSGMASHEDLSKTIRFIKKNSNSEVCVLKCTSLYPPKDTMLNLNAINNLSKKYKVIPGFSDHTIDTLAPVVAVAKGAKVIEKHFKISKNDNCPDKKISLFPQEFEKMCKQIRRTEKMFGLSVIKPNVDELKMKKKIYRYIFARRNLISGQKLKLEDLVYKRSNLNFKKIEPKDYKKIVNKILKKNISKNIPINLGDLC
jgi:sialic acid synthase SpsE